jgi:hypothetical protein
MQHVLNMMLGSNAHSGRDMITQRGEPLPRDDITSVAQLQQLQKVINQPGMMMNIVNYLTHGPST